MSVPPAAAAPPPVGNGERILIVDDDSLNQKIFGSTLRKAGFEVAHAYSGAEALTMVEGSVPDLVLLDYQMPGINGPETLRRMRAMTRMKDVPVLMLTAADSEEQKAAGFSAGADDYLVKPIDPRLLRARIAAVLAARRGG